MTEDGGYFCSQPNLAPLAGNSMNTVYNSVATTIKNLCIKKKIMGTTVFRILCKSQSLLLVSYDIILSSYKMQPHSTRNDWASPGKLFYFNLVNIMDYVIDQVS